MISKKEYLEKYNKENLQRKKNKAVELLKTIEVDLPHHRRLQVKKVIAKFIEPTHEILFTAIDLIDGTGEIVSKSDNTKCIDEATEALAYSIKQCKDISDERIDYWIRETGKSKGELLKLAKERSKTIVLEVEQREKNKKKILEYLKEDVKNGEDIPPNKIVRSARVLNILPKELRDKLDYHKNEEKDAFCIIQV